MKNRDKEKTTVRNCLHPRDKEQSMKVKMKISLETVHKKAWKVSEKTNRFQKVVKLQEHKNNKKQKK